MLEDSKNNRNWGARVVYNGSPVNGKCTNTIGENTQINYIQFNRKYTKKQHVGYMYGDDDNPYKNNNDSSIKEYIDNWYETNIKDKDFESSVDKASIYCGDRTEGSVDGDWQYYAGRDRTEQNKPSLKCPTNDSYGVEAGNRKLKYPSALLSSDEVMLAGGQNWKGNNSNYYLYTSNTYWLLSPGEWSSSTYADMLGVDGYGCLSTLYVPVLYGLRPAITIAPSASLLSGTGSPDDPYVI